MSAGNRTAADAPPPWRLAAEIAVGGLHSIGFVPGTSIVLIVSQQGRGLHDATTGNRLARDRDDSWIWYDPSGPAAFGIGDYADARIQVAGLDGGQLRTRTDDDWRLASNGAEVLLGKLGNMVPFSPRWPGEEIRAYGFADSGESLAVAVGSHTVEVYTRVEREKDAGEH